MLSFSKISFVKLSGQVLSLSDSFTGKENFPYFLGTRLEYILIIDLTFL